MANLPISGATKIEVAVSEGHLDGRTEYVPIKKRRFVYRSPSPPPPPPPSSSSPQSTENDMPEKIECHLGQESFTCHNGAFGQTVEANVINMNKVDGENNHMNVNEDYPGISILANASCSIDFGQEEEFPWDLNKVGTDQQDYEDLDCETDTIGAISKNPFCNVSGKMENNKAISSPYLLETCISIQSEVAMETVAAQDKISGHDITDIVIPPNDPASLAGIQVQEIFELKRDCDSEYEDGELKESTELIWNEHDVQDGEAEHVSYESDAAERFGSNAFNRKVSMSEASLKNIRKSNFPEEATISRASNLKLYNGPGTLQHADGKHRKDERGFIDRRDIELKVFESRLIRKEFQSQVENSTYKRLWPREFRVQGSRFNDFNETKSRYGRDQKTHESSFGHGSIPSDHNGRQTRNSTDRHIKRARSPSRSPTSSRGRYTRDYQGRFDDIDSDHRRHLVARKRSFSPAENPMDFHSNQPYRRKPVISHDFRSGERSLNLRTSHVNARFSQRPDRRFPTRIIPSNEAYGVSESPQRVNQNICSRPRHHERYYKVGKENDYERGYRNKCWNPDDDDFEITRYVDRHEFSGAAARRHKELQNSFFHRRDRGFYAYSK